MDNLDLLQQAFVFLAAAVVAVPLASRLGLGSVLGYLIAGAALGPFGLGLGGDPEAVMHASEFGVVLLLFLVGLELEPKRLADLRRDVFGLGSAQVAATTLALGAAAMALGLPWRAALVVGFGLSLSSTALVVQLLSERRELGAPHGRAAFGILLFQDLAVIPMLAVLPLLAPAGAEPAGAAPGWQVALTAAGAIAAVVALSRFLVRPLLRLVAGLRNPELFTATALLLVVATALGISAAGLSMALGAFLAGVLLAGSEYRHELEADIAPFKGLLLGLFFIAVGMSANLALIAQRPLLVLGLAAAIHGAKALLGWGVGRLLVNRGDPALSLGILLAQGGEFAFVLFSLAVGQRVMDPEHAQLLVVAVTLSMAATPVLFALHVRTVRRWLSRGPARPWDVAPVGDPPVIVAGFGRVGQVVGRVLQAKRIPFTAIDASSEHIEFLQRFGNKVFFGDVARLELLRAARAGQAEVFVLAVDDVEASVRTAQLLREHFPHLQVFARARNRQHAYRLRGLGVTRIFRETLATSLELTAGVLEALGEDSARARGSVERFRTHDQELFESSWQHAGDMEQLTRMAARGREELERLFAEDARERRSA
jgi:glutathione-regulated potassium-efflux system protein KefB